MKKHFLELRLTALIIFVCATCIGATAAQDEKASRATESARDEAHAHSARRVMPATLTPAERIAWQEIQERTDRMSHGEEAKDLRAAMNFMTDDYTLYTLPEKGSDKGKILNRQEIADYKKRNLESLYLTSPETHTDIESLQLKGNLATVVVYQYYVRVIRGGDGSPHQAISSVRHRETWEYTERGWLQKVVQELEQGAIFLDGQPYDPSRTNR